MPNSPHVTRSSLRHLSPDFDWDLLEQQTSHLNATNAGATEDNLPSLQFTADSKGKGKKEGKLKKDKKGAIPKTTPASSSLPEFSSCLQYDQGGTPPNTQDEIIRLQLVKDNHDREIHKLELRLQLAQLENKMVGSTPSEASNNKSLSDMKAPQKIVNPQQWPHIFAPAEPKLYGDLSLPEFCAGYLVIINQLVDKLCRTALINHFHELMILASTYQWPAVRSYHYKVLRPIELGLVQWGDSFEPFKQSFFLATCLLTEAPHKAAKPSSKSPATSLESPSTVARHQMHGAGMTSDCPKSHICVVCKCPDHQTLCCPKRKFPVPPRRSDTASKD